MPPGAVTTGYARQMAPGSGLDADPGRASHRLLVELGGKGRVAVVGQGPLELAVVDAAQGQRR